MLLQSFYQVTWLLSRVLALKSKVLLSTSVVYSARAMLSFSLGHVVPPTRRCCNDCKPITFRHRSRTVHVPPLRSEFPATCHQDLKQNTLPPGATHRLFRTTYRCDANHAAACDCGSSPQHV
ncbi:hypothetical protein BJV77DRAFT_688106 [Russula vinacea]|nr:hypothetical protein BJV77DRAFT_688106 [Russula vinacea]